MEVLIEKKDLEGGAEVKVVTPVKGFERVWGLILGKFIRESQLGDVFIEINDNYAAPLVASMRLSQALAEAKEAEMEG
jgi:malonate decarboxylase acyl carrier protein